LAEVRFPPSFDEKRLSGHGALADIHRSTQRENIMPALVIDALPLLIREQTEVFWQ
jgi:hypothetical protein